MKKIFAGVLAASVVAAAVTGYMKMRRGQAAQAEQIKVGD